MNLRELFTKERELRMIWRIERDGKISYLAGASHFFRYSFKKSLRRYIINLDTVLLEGPLDEESMERVIDSGEKGEGFPSLYNSLDNDTINKILAEIGYHSPDISSLVRYKDLLITKEVPDPDPLQIEGLRPWMAFFKIWFSYLGKHGWRYTMDVDTFKIAKELGKDVYFLETIGEQIEALNGIPLERIVNYLKRVELWKKYRKFYVKNFLKGNIENIMSLAEEFPARCESIIEKRDPILCERMNTFFGKGNIIALVGVVHIQEIKRLLLKNGYVIQDAP